MTVVEYFDTVSIENIATALFCEVDKLIYVGSDEKLLTAAIRRYTPILRRRGISTALDYRLAPSQRDLQEIVSLLENIVLENREIVFNLEGGEDLYLVAAGIVYARYRDRVQLHRAHIPTGSFLNVGDNTAYRPVRPPRLSIEENIQIYGGDVVEQEDRLPFYSSRQNYTADFQKDIMLIWSIRQKNSAVWNSHLSSLEKLQSDFGDVSLTLSVDKRQCPDSLIFESPMLYDMEKCGIIKNLTNDRKHLSFTYKSYSIKELMKKEGNILEAYVSICGLAAKDALGKPLFNDVRTGVVINWSEHIHRNQICVTNEIDVVLMRGMVPVFISCKNGKVTPSELYKLNAVAVEFGNRYAKKALVTTTLDYMEPMAEETFRQRAKELNIDLLVLHSGTDCVHLLETLYALSE